VKISVFGLGYVGAVSLVCLARDGHHVVGVDVDTAKLELIRAGRTPVVEEGMVDLMAEVAASGRVSVANNAHEAILRTDVSLVCVGTPSAPNGSQDQSALIRFCEQVGTVLARKTTQHVLVFRSTIVPGTIEDVLIPLIEKTSGLKAGEDFHVAFQPEFLREGSSIRDYDHPPFTIVGSTSEFAIATLRELFGHLPCELHETSIRAAEMVKYCCNNFHALKITFANETARLCDALNVDPFEVMDLLCKDKQLNISKAYLRPGFAFGGSCLPKDLRATLHLAKQRDVELPMLGSVLTSNRLQVEKAVEKVLATERRRVGFIGLSFKTGTDDLRESPLVALAEQLIGKGISLLVYDPDVHLSRLLGANRRFIEQRVPHIGSLIRPDLQEVVTHSDVLVVGLAHAGIFKELRGFVRRDHVVIDLARIPDARDWPCTVDGLCW
jgi:GDP-mannose 6-dehydrogenase